MQPDLNQIVADALPAALIVLAESQRDQRKERVMQIERMLQDMRRADGLGDMTHVLWIQGEDVCMSVTMEDQFVTSDPMNATRMTPQDAPDIVQQARDATAAFIATMPPEDRARAKCPNYIGLHLGECLTAIKAMHEEKIRNLDREIDIARTKAAKKIADRNSA